MPAAAVFIRQQRQRLDRLRTHQQRPEVTTYGVPNEGSFVTNIPSTDPQWWNTEPDSSWAKDYSMSAHASIVCYRQDSHDPNNSNRLVKDFPRCSAAWQKEKGSWRNDHVWFQEFPEEEGHRVSRAAIFGGKSIGKLLLILTIRDTERRDEKGKPRLYSGVFMDTLRWCNNGIPNDTHGMIELQPWPESQAARPRYLGGRRIYEISTVSRSAHVVPAELQGQRKFYLDNWLDWEQYNECYDEDFMCKGTRVATEWADHRASA